MMGRWLVLAMLLAAACVAVEVNVDDAKRGAVEGKVDDAKRGAVEGKVDGVKKGSEKQQVGQPAVPPKQANNAEDNEGTAQNPPVVVASPPVEGTAASPAAAASVRLYHVFGVAFGCFIIVSILTRRTSKTNATRITNIGSAAVLLTFALFCYQGISGAARVGALSWKLFFQFMMAGGICAFLTHAGCTPIDVVKTRLQTQANRYTGPMDALKSIIRDEGPATLLKGLGATATGYFLHGAFKYSFYEVFKVILAKSPEVAVQKPPLSVAAAAGFFAECVACLLLCPMEAVRIRSVSDPTFPSSVSGGLRLLMKTEGFHGLFKGLASLLLRQVPYTVGQFVAFEFALVFVKLTVEPFFASGGTENISSTGVMIISLGAGLLAGAMASVISQPGDTILSKINQEESDETSSIVQIRNIVVKLGFSGLFLGLGTRLIQVSCMIGGQFLIYDSIKLLCGIRPASAIPSSVANAAGQVDVPAEK